MELNELLKKEIEHKLEQHLHESVKIIEVSPVHGGDTQSCFHLETTRSSFFLKESPSPPSPDFFQKEYDGLQLLRKQDVINVAEPLFYGSAGGSRFLVTEYISKSPADASFWELFARGLAELHRCSQKQFGLEEDNYIGPLPQPNTPQDNWPDFYISQRLQPLIRNCIDRELLDTAFMDKAVQLYKRLPDLFPEEPPALLHGDLWGGNYLCGPISKPYLFDPAVYYGHREMDLAMTRLFGGFDRRFYWHYETFFPLADGWQNRIILCQLYPLLVHSLLFGGGYVQQVRSILDEYGR